MTHLPRSAFLVSGSSTASTLAAASARIEPPAPEGLVQIMLSALELTGTERVLEIGSSSAYETALLSRLASDVVSMDSEPGSAEARVRLLATLGCDNVRVALGKSAAGWPSAAPYQAILVAGGASRLPQRLLDQLDVGGRLVIPLGDDDGQLLELVRKRVDGIVSEALGPCHLPMLAWATRPDSLFPWRRTDTHH